MVDDLDNDADSLGYIQAPIYKIGRSGVLYAEKNLSRLLTVYNRELTRVKISINRYTLFTIMNYVSIRYPEMFLGNMIVERLRHRDADPDSSI